MKKYIYVPLFLFLGFLFFHISSVQAATLYYDASSDTDWNTTANWWTDAGHSAPGTVPGIGDDAVIDGNVDSNGGPEASVNTMTVNGSFYTAAPITVANGASYHDTSINLGVLTVTSGDASFFDSTRNVASITGNAVFNDSSYNSGHISGNAIFNYISGGMITLSGSEQWGIIDGTAKGSDAVLITQFIFNDSSVNNGNIANNPTFNDSSRNKRSISGDATFHDSSHNDGSISANATFNDTSYNRSNNCDPDCGTVSGNAVFNDSSYNSGGTVSGNATFNNSSYNDGTVSGNASFYDLTINQGTVTGNACFAATADRDGGTVGVDLGLCSVPPPVHHPGGGSGRKILPPSTISPCNEGDKFSTTTGLLCLSYVPPILSLCPITKTLRLGMKSCEVLELHKKLIALKFYFGLPDDTFGRTLKTAVIKFQLAHELKGDGVVGPLTRAALNK